MTDQSPAPLILVDGSSYLFRAFHGLPPLTNKEGHPTGAIKGVISMLRRMMADFPDSHMAVIFDAKGKTFRNDMYEEYKANRPPMPDDLRVQIQPIHEMIRAMGIPLLVVEGVEADDVIGTLCHQATEQGVDTIVSTGDKDMAQLVSEHVSLVNTMTNTTMNREGVIEKFGLAPEQIIDYLALMGDKVDNIPGVPGCGPKTAVKWLAEYQTLENLTENAEQIKGKIGEKLRANLEQLPLSKALATIKCDVELEQGPKELVLGEVDDAALLGFFNTFGFKSWAEELTNKGVEMSEVAATSGSASENTESVDVVIPHVADTEYLTLLDADALKTWVSLSSTKPIYALYPVVSNDHYKAARLIGMALSVEPGKAVYVPLAHDYVGAPEQLSPEVALELLQPLLTGEAINQVGHNTKKVAHLLANYDQTLVGQIHDVMLQSYVLNSVESKHELTEIASLHLNETLKNDEAILGKGKKRLEASQLETDAMAEFACAQVDMILRSYLVLSAKLKQEAQLDWVYQWIERKLSPVLTDVEANGVQLDQAELHKQSQYLTETLATIEEEAYGLAGEAFNMNSPKQIGEILYEKLELPVKKKTPKGAPSTAEPVLQELAQEFPLPKLILEHRSLAKLKSTYTDALPELVRPETGRLHTTYQQAVAATGRLSSTEPNLQNIPIRTEEGRKVRKAFVARPGYKVLAADYSQVELRIMAHLSGDEGLVNAFKHDLDVHRATAAEVFHESLEDVTSDQRRKAKAINFGLIYGMSAFGLAQQLDIARGEAAEYVKRYFEKYPGVKEYMDQTRGEAEDKGYVETLFGRRLYLPGIRSSNQMVKQGALRTAINAPMQGTAADVIKMAMIDVHNWLREAKVDAKLVMQVHDELVLEVAESDVDLVTEGVRFRMENAASLAVPLLVDVGVGDSWDEAH
ncbi:DNA polymerase I [Litoribrevibacter albus]|uniref:DNA polymerase I n=1 Tax=Litoribrevibacter albus TaxID=1473156 RepID=A0AA37SBI4_9GAMM|nr:DNA polymerase I [Litoribrevibacter albus]GLQ32970.1 DNA polymerase I [Litoribrevibacter albus]